MSVPESVRKVARPVNTIVEDSGRDTKYRYAVRERGEIVYENGSNPRPKNGKVILLEKIYFIWNKTIKEQNS